MQRHFDNRGSSDTSMLRLNPTDISITEFTHSPHLPDQRFFLSRSELPCLLISTAPVSTRYQVLHKRERACFLAIQKLHMALSSPFLTPAQEARSFIPPKKKECDSSHKKRDDDGGCHNIRSGEGRKGRVIPRERNAECSSPLPRIRFVSSLASGQRRRRQAGPQQRRAGPPARG